MFSVSLTAREDARRIPQSGPRRYVRSGSDAGGAYVPRPRKFPRDDGTLIRSWLSKLSRKRLRPKQYSDQGIHSSTFRNRFQKILADICMGTCAAVSNRQTATISLTARNTPRPVRYPNHQGCEFTHEEHAPDYATHVSDNF